MSTTRIGKIGRLPRQVREELNRRLLEGEPGTTLVDWLNGLPSVPPVLDRWFGGRPVTEQNLSEWRQGGFEDWQRQEEARAWVRELGEETQGLGDAGELGDRFACVLAVELTRLAKVLLNKEGEPEVRWEKLCAVSQELSRLRRDEQRAVQTRIREEQWALAKAKQEAEAEEREAAKRREKELAPFKAAREVNYRAMFYGGGKDGRRVAERLVEIEYGLEHGTLNVERLQAALRKPRKKARNRAKSDLIQPNDSNAECEPGDNANEDGHSNAEFGMRSAGGEVLADGQHRDGGRGEQSGNPGESNLIQPDEGVKAGGTYDNRWERAREELRRQNEEILADGQHGGKGQGEEKEDENG